MKPIVVCLLIHIRLKIESLPEISAGHLVEELNEVMFCIFMSCKCYLLKFVKEKFELTNVFLGIVEGLTLKKKVTSGINHAHFQFKYKYGYR